jgi:hypothetical protein
MTREFLNGEEQRSVNGMSDCILDVSTLSYVHHNCVTIRFHPGRYYSLTVLLTRSTRCWTVLTGSRTREASKAQLPVLTRQS